MTRERVFIDGATGKVADWTVCLCGNEPHIEGFYPCLPTGEVVEPDHQWVQTLYYCERCHRIIDMITGTVSGQADDEIVEANNRRYDQ
jgi:hypothetical protein